jgi:hypothetical protein
MKYHTLNAPSHSVLEEAHQIKPQPNAAAATTAVINGHSNTNAVSTVTTQKVSRNDSIANMVARI